MHMYSTYVCAYAHTLTIWTCENIIHCYKEITIQIEGQIIPVGVGVGAM